MVAYGLQGVSPAGHPLGNWLRPVRGYLPPATPQREIETYFAGLALQYEEVCGESIGLFSDVTGAGRELRLMNYNTGARFVSSATEYLRGRLWQEGITVEELQAGYASYLDGGQRCPRDTPARARIMLGDQLIKIGQSLEQQGKGSDPLLLSIAVATVPFVGRALRAGKLESDEIAYRKMLPLLVSNNTNYRNFGLKLLSHVDKDTDPKRFLRIPLELKKLLILFEQVKLADIPSDLKNIWTDTLNRLVAVASKRDLNGVRIQYLERALGVMLLFVDVIEEGRRSGRRSRSSARPLEKRLELAFEEFLKILEHPLYSHYMDVMSEIYRDVNEAAQHFESMIIEDERKKGGGRSGGSTSSPAGSGSPPANPAPSAPSGGQAGLISSIAGASPSVEAPAGYYPYLDTVDAPQRAQYNPYALQISAPVVRPPAVPFPATIFHATFFAARR